jgi:O-antigen/teichoic acid export membrane protein
VRRTVPESAAAVAVPRTQTDGKRAWPRVAENATTLVTARLVSVACVVATTPVLFGMLGARQFGLWSLLVATFAVAGLADLGLGSAQTREVAQAAATGDPRRARMALAIAALVYGLLGLLLLVFILVGWPAFAAAFNLANLAGTGRHAALFLLAAFTVDLSAMPWRATLEGNQRMRPIAATIVASAVCEASLGVTLVAAGAGLAGLGAAAVAASCLRAAMLVRPGQRSLAGLRPSLRGATAKEVRSVLGYGLSIQATHAAAAVNTQTDRLLLGALFSPVIVAPFVIGSRLVTALNIVPSYVISSLFPALTTLHARGERILVDGLYLRATRYLALFGCLSGATLMVTAEPLVELWIGKQLPLAATTIVVLSPALAVGLAAGGAAALTRAEGRPGRETRAALLAVGLNLGLTMPLVLVFGAKGVPLATGLAIAIATLYFVLHFHRSSDRPLAPVLAVAWKPFAACGFAVVFTRAAFGLLPDGAGRLDAAAATISRAAGVVVLATAALACLRFFDGADRVLVYRCRARIGLAPAAPLPSSAGHGTSR